MPNQVSNSSGANSGASKGIAIVAEDSGANAAALGMFIKQLGFTVRTFPDGKFAWDHLDALSATDLKEVKIIFSDYMMPRMDGKELLLKIRAKPSLEKLPFVFYTAVVDPALIREVLSISQGYLVKPTSLTTVKKKFESIFGPVFG